MGVHGDFEKDILQVYMYQTFMQMNIAEKKKSRTFSAPKNGMLHEENIQYTAVSRKVVLQTGKSLRDNVESYYG